MPTINGVSYGYIFNPFTGKIQYVTSPSGIGSPIASGTSGSVLYIDSSGNLAQKNSNLYFDDTHNYFIVRSANASTTGAATAHFIRKPTSFSDAVFRCEFIDPLSEGWPTGSFSVEEGDPAAQVVFRGLDFQAKNIGNSSIWRMQPNRNRMLMIDTVSLLWENSDEDTTYASLQRLSTNGGILAKGLAGGTILAVRGASAQSANIFDVQDSSTASLVTVSPTGALTTYNSLGAPTIGLTIESFAGDGRMRIRNTNGAAGMIFWHGANIIEFEASTLLRFDGVMTLPNTTFYGVIAGNGGDGSNTNSLEIKANSLSTASDYLDIFTMRYATSAYPTMAFTAPSFEFWSTDSTWPSQARAGSLFLSLSGSTATPTQRVLLSTLAAGTKGLVLKAASFPSVNLMEFQNSSVVVKGSFGFESTSAASGIFEANGTTTGGPGFLVRPSNGSGRGYLMTHNDAAGAFAFLRTDITAGLQFIIRDFTGSAGGYGIGISPYPDATSRSFINILQSAGDYTSPMILTPGEAGAQGYIQFGRRSTDDNSAVGCTAEFWPKSGQTFPAMSVVKAGTGTLYDGTAAAYRFQVATSGDITLSSESSTTNSRGRGLIHTEWISSTDASRKARITLSVYDTSVHEFMRADADGTFGRVGFGGATNSTSNVLIKPLINTEIGLTLQGLSSQSGSLLQALDDSSVTRFSLGIGSTGSSLTFIGPSGVSTNFMVLQTDDTSNTITTKLGFKLLTNSDEAMRGESTGSAPKIGFLGASSVVRQSGDIGTGLVNLGLFSSTFGQKAFARSTAQTGAVASVATYTLSASDASFFISSNINVTAYTAGTVTVQCDYTDETNTARTFTFTFSNLTGTLSSAIGTTGPYEGFPAHIRCKASTALTIKTTVSLFTGTYNVEGYITQIG